MAANTIVTAPRQPLARLRQAQAQVQAQAQAQAQAQVQTPVQAQPVAPRADAAARAAARTAPRGEGLATVVALPVRRSVAASGAASVAASGAAAAPMLRVVPTAARPRRMAMRIAGLVVAAALLLTGVLGTAMVSADEPVAAGHVVLQPGETLWDVAVRSAPAGVDPRRQLDAVRRLNGFGPGALDAWTVVLIPAP